MSRPRRQVRVTEHFFVRLDELLPDSRTADGGPSATDFILHDMPAIIDRLADDYEGSTLPVDGTPQIRMLIAAGMLVPFFVVYATIAPDNAIEILYLDIDRAVP